MATKNRQKLAVQAEVVRHLDTPTSTVMKDPMDAIWTMDTDDPFMDPVLAEVIENFRRDALVTPRTLADIKHPPVSSHHT